jgi:hypothetical protein
MFTIDGVKDLKLTLGTDEATAFASLQELQRQRKQPSFEVVSEMLK